jgi:hypothetical protein
LFAQSFELTAIAILAILIVNLLVKCGPKASSTASTSLSSPSSGNGAGSPFTANGTSDQGGGGNLIKGKPIDFYAVDITSLPEYTHFVEPIDRGIERALNSGSLLHEENGHESYLKAVAKSKTWYLLPIQLDELPASRIGTLFASIQGARQTEKEVFISAPEYDNMTDENKGKLLVHELRMGLFRTKFGEMSFYCSVNTDQVAQNSCLSSVKEHKDSAYFKPKIQTEFLLQDQYQSIRDTANWLWIHFKDMSAADFIDQLYQHGFDDRWFNPSRVRLSTEQVLQYNLKPTDFMTLVKSQGQMNALPKYCGFNQEFPMKSSDTCDIGMQFHDDQLELTVSSALPVGGEKVRKLYFSFPLNAADVQLLPENYRSGMKLFSVTLQEAPSYKSTPGAKSNYELAILLAPLNGSNYQSSTYEVTRLKINRLVEREAGSYWETKPKDLDDKIQFIYSSDKAPLYSEEARGQ